MTASPVEIGTRASVNVTRRLAPSTFAAASITYGVGRLLAGMIMAAVAAGSPRIDLAAEIGAATIVGAAVAGLAPLITGTRGSRVARLGALLFVSVAAVMLEGAAFAPSLSPLAQLPGALVLQLVVCGATAIVAVARSGQPAERTVVARRSGIQVAWRVGACALAYTVAYFGSGALNYALVTGPYYADHVGGLVTPEPAVVLLVAVVEGIVLTLGTVPLARVLAGTRRTRAIVVGLALWLFGGLVPLIQQASLPDVIRVASVVEILFQKVPLGIAVVWLLAADPATRTASPRELRRQSEL